jgi:hypothetical protein
MMGLWLGLMCAAGAEVIPLRTPEPALDRRGLLYVQSRPRIWHSCHLIAVVDQHGYVVTTLLKDCPEPLRTESMNTLARWDYYPPNDGGQAKAADVDVVFRFISGVVLTDAAPGDDRPRVRVPPAALPLWPTPPRLKGPIKRATEEAGSAGVSCAMTVSFSGRGVPIDPEILDCPQEAADIALARLSRFGVQLIQAEPGDGTRYLYEVWLPVERRAKEP